MIIWQELLLLLCIWALLCVWHNRVWPQTCLCTIVSGNNLLLAQPFLGTNVSGHNRMSTSMHGNNCVISLGNPYRIHPE